MTEAAIIFPNQLFLKHPALEKAKMAFIVEDPRFFYDSQDHSLFHKQKLVMHRASMKHFAAKHQNITYLDFKNAETSSVMKTLVKKKVVKIYIVSPVDDNLSKRYISEAKRHGIEIEWLSNPNFLTTIDDFTEFFSDKKRYHQTDFYIWQRKKLNLLMVKNKPKGGKWTYDSDNRLKLPKDIDPPEPLFFSQSSNVKEALAYVEKNFPNHYGKINNFNYPTTHNEAKKLLEHFLTSCLSNFGPYQDAITPRSDALFHSKLSAPLNIGLLNPDEIVNTTIEFSKSHKIPLPSLEGFLRQVVGWREFFRAVYVLEGGKIRNSNFFHHKRKLSCRWYKGTIGIPPVDDAIHKLLDTAYAHHIERLMILGNFMLLCEIDPNEIYRWFMEMFIDSYDWVMVPNVYSMSQYADEGLIVTKPYISGSNYIRKMSDYPTGEWCSIWDGLYWSFLDKHRQLLGHNPRMIMVYNILNKMDSDKLESHKKKATEFLTQVI